MTSSRPFLPPVTIHSVNCAFPASETWKTRDLKISNSADLIRKKVIIMSTVHKAKNICSYCVTDEHHEQSEIGD